MAIQDYTKAQKMAEKQYRTAVSRGEYPFLPSLDGILRGVERIKKENNEEIVEKDEIIEDDDITKRKELDGQQPMGQLEIPLALIAGTAQSDRKSAFASNFMPLLDYETEFGSKWSALCDSVREVGVNEPIIVYEYMQRFYIVEGNKRVSVSKYFGAVSIGAVVTRLLPKPTDDTDYLIYREFMEFFRISGIYEIQMTQPGGFLRLVQAITPTDTPDNTDTKAPQPAPWGEELRRDVKFMYSVFERYYSSKIGTRLSITPGDAFLHFIEIYGFQQLKGLSSVELHRKIDRIRGEFRVLSSENPTSHILNPTEGSQKVSLLNKVIPLPIGQSSVLQIAFLYPKHPDDSAWIFNHEVGRCYIEKVFGNTIKTQYYICTAEQGEETIAKAIADGNTLIFTTSPFYHACSMRMAVAHPEVIILNCSVNTAYQQLRTYYLRIYEAKFITGIIAGSMTEIGRIGYVADYPILGALASVNAFALGVKLVNPRATVYLDWSTLENHDPVAYFHSKQIDMISRRDINERPHTKDQPEEPDYGLYGVYGDTSFHLASPFWNWGNLYEDLVRSVLIGAWKNDANQNEKQALNYYWGMSSGAIDVACSKRLPIGTQKLVKLVQERITMEKFKPFSGPIYSQDGKCRVEENQSLTPDEIITQDWLADNVVGRLPEISELAPEFREFAKWHSIQRQTGGQIPRPVI
ncbi:MAG: BMP family ABC transporter substrate-binding protein [Oscillospiraceae bacterium]|nr:BMP family ABC transporter substrate-binding protein [Oscillospiraceae bacterium]MCR4759161.1 BMP family ABC transporter substrate-binding protein [Oscillospiraceae bacterium]